MKTVHKENFEIAEAEQHSTCLADTLNPACQPDGIHARWILVIVMGAMDRMRANDRNAGIQASDNLLTFCKSG